MFSLPYDGREAVKMMFWTFLVSFSRGMALAAQHVRPQATTARDCCRKRHRWPHTCPAASPDHE